MALNHGRRAFLGKAPDSFAIAVDGKPVASSLTGSSYKLDLASLKPGTHHVQLTAAGVHTLFPLDESRATEQSEQQLPVVSEITFHYGLQAKIQ